MFATLNSAPLKQTFKNSLSASLNYRIKTLLSICYFSLLPLFLVASAAKAENQAPQQSHGIAMHGLLNYKPDFKHFNYANPNAPKGGVLNLGVQGTFTSLNPYNIKGGAASGVSGYLYETLLGRALDEPFSLYGLIAESIEVPEDRSYITFTLNPKARFSDGKQVTVADVIYSHKLLKENGRPNHRTYYSKVKSVETIGEHSVKFIFDANGDREIPLIMGLMPILPKHLMTKDEFSKTSFKKPIGSGPYTIDTIDPGKFITYKRDPNYWGKDLPVNTGRYNFDEIKFTYYRDANTLFEAFKSGLHDIQYENDPGKWSTSYNFKSIKDGRVVKKQFDLKIPSGMSALVFNTRRPQFKDQLVRKALMHLFNFEDINRKIYHNLYTRTTSYFDRSILSSNNNRADETEQKILPENFKFEHPNLFTGDFRFPTNRGKGIDRKNIRAATKLLKQAGYILEAGQMIHNKTRQPLTFEIMTLSKNQEALTLSFIENLKLVGIKASIRQVDSTQYQKRLLTYDFDMFQNNWSGSLSPGNEQLFRWSSAQANNDGSYNYPGIKDPNVDRAIQALLEAKTSQTFISSVRALDRLLLSGDYVIPLFHLKGQWLAHWSYLGQPETASFYGTVLDSWWDKRVSK